MWKRQKAIALLFFAFGSLPFVAHTQSADSARLSDPFSLGARAHYGFIIAHSRDIINVSNSNPRGIEVSASWLLNREKYTRNSGIVARRGFVAQYMNFDNPTVLGHCISVAPFIEPMICPWRRFYASVQLGVGFSYLTKVYDDDSNPTNLFFSTPISFLAMTNAYFFYKINPHWEASLGFNYNHISNGGMKLPNKGMNFPTWNFGANYNFHPTDITRPAKNDDWKKQPRNFAYLLSIATLKTATATEVFPENKLCWQLGAMALVGRRVRRLSGLSVGMEWVHDGYAQEILRRENVEKSAWKGATLFGHELLINRVRFNIHLGAYVHNPSGDIDPVYQRYGLYYRFGKHIIFGSTLKAHRHVADVFDMRLGWVW